MGRATEGFDFINKETISKSEFNERYGSLGNYQEMKEIRKDFRKGLQEVVPREKKTEQKSLF